MRAWSQHPVRVTRRVLWLGAELLLGAIDYLCRCAFRTRDRRAKRAAWLHRLAQRVLKVFGVDARSVGAAPATGLLVSNHLGYLDIPLLAALTPCVFVAKSDVRGWPVFGWFARLAGTIFVRRDRPSYAGRSAAEIELALVDGALVVLFPEGTSSGGETVLPFKSALLHPALCPGRAVTAAHINYALTEGDVSEEVCYWKDMTLVPHLLNLLAKDSVRAEVRFIELEPSRVDRKQLAQQLRHEILRLKTEAVFQS